jgi:ABC-type lipoprotein release transport system permease subunit
MDDAITEGSYFKGDDPLDMVIGSELAKVLEVGIGSRVVVTASQAHTSALAQEMFRVSGIYHMDVKELDKGMAFVRIAKAREMLNLEGEAHEIALKFKNSEVGGDPDNPFWAAYSRGGNEAVGWPQLVPELENAMKISEFMTYIVGIVLFSVVALGIVNTLFMSMHERLFEFGVMRAVGTSPFQMGRLVLFEAGSLAIVSILLGMILGFLVVYAFSIIGIDYSGIEFAGVTFRQLLYPILDVKQFVTYPAWAFVFTVIVALYPAFYAARLRPAEAMRKSF